MSSTLTMNEDPGSNEPIRPWYRHRWPWLLAIAPLAAIVGGMVTLWLAATTSDSLVVDDYYREGRAINQQLARDRVAASLGLHAQLRFATAGTRAAVGDEGGRGAVDDDGARGAVDEGALGDTPADIELRVQAQRGSAWPQSLRLRIVHATRAELDRDYTLAHVGDGVYRARGVVPDAGRWLVQLEDPARTWRLVAQGVTGFDEALELQVVAQ